MKFTISSYNILADPYIEAKYFPDTPAELLARERRWPALARHIAALDADVLCLQEVTQLTYELIGEALGPGYRGLFAQKRSARPDGCATFLRRATFELEAAAPLYYADADPPSGHLVLFTTLRHGDRLMTVANTHVKWDPLSTPDRERWGMRQMTELLAAPMETTRIVCGDLNAPPTSAVVRAALAAGLRDAYAATDDAFTCNSNKVPKRIDFILVSEGLATTTRALPRVRPDTMLPSETEPSDHLAILAEIVA